MGNPLARAVRRMRSAGSGGEVKSLPTHAFLSAFQHNQPLWTDWDSAKAVKEGFKASAIVYACVRTLMQTAASVPWSAYVRAEPRKGSRRKWETAENHPLTELLERPNEHMSRQQLVERLTAHLYLGGNSILQQIRVRGTTVELWPIHDLSKIKVVPSRTDFIARYEVDVDGRQVPLEPEDVVHAMFTDPSNPYWGMSPLMAAARVVDTDVEAVKWNKVALQNRAVPDGVFSAKNTITRDQYDEMRLMVREQYEDRARAPWVLGAGTEFHQMGLSPVEMDFLESRKNNRAEIASVFGVPLPIIGFYEDATLANIETARKIFWGDTVKPFLEGVRSSLAHKIVPDFGDPRQLTLAPDYSEVEALREDLTGKIDNAVKLHSIGVPVNAINQRLELDLDEIPGGDVGLVSATLVPLTRVGEGTDEGDPPVEL